MLRILSRMPLRGGPPLVFALGFVAVACSDRPAATSPSRPLAQASAMNVCDVEGLWAAVAGSPSEGSGRSNGTVFFDIFNQVPPAPEDNDASETYALATQLALGLGNAGEGDKYHFRFQTVLVASGAMAQGHGFLFVPSSTGLATFVVAGKGTHPFGRGLTEGEGWFKLSGGGNVTCALGEGTDSRADVNVEYEDGETEKANVFMVHCPPGEPCNAPT
jgi:hypothetical protein